MQTRAAKRSLSLLSPTKRRDYGWDGRGNYVLLSPHDKQQQLSSYLDQQGGSGNGSGIGNGYYEENPGIALTSQLNSTGKSKILKSKEKNRNRSIRFESDQGRYTGSNFASGDFSPI